MNLASSTNSGIPERLDCQYCACYCEENVYQLLKCVDPTALQFYYAVIISNEFQTVSTTFCFGARSYIAPGGTLHAVIF
jgi:hypothetical protein